MLLKLKLKITVTILLSTLFLVILLSNPTDEKTERSVSILNFISLMLSIIGCVYEISYELAPKDEDEYDITPLIVGGFDVLTGWFAFISFSVRIVTLDKVNTNSIMFITNTIVFTLILVYRVINISFNLRKNNRIYTIQSQETQNV